MEIGPTQDPAAAPAPVPVIPLQYMAADLARRPWQRTVRVLAWLAWTTVAVGWSVMLVEVESVLASGAALSILGLALSVFSSRASLRGGVWLGFSHYFVCLLFITLVNVRHWSPGEAHEPFIAMGLLHLVLTLIATVRLDKKWLRPSRET